MTARHLLGHGAKKLIDLLKENAALDPKNIVFYGTNSIDPKELEALRELKVAVFTMMDLEFGSGKERFHDHLLEIKNRLGDSALVAIENDFDVLRELPLTINGSIKGASGAIMANSTGLTWANVKLANMLIGKIFGKQHIFTAVTEIRTEGPASGWAGDRAIELAKLVAGIPDSDIQAHFDLERTRQEIQPAEAGLALPRFRYPFYPKSERMLNWVRMVAQKPVLAGSLLLAGFGAIGAGASLIRSNKVLANKNAELQLQHSKLKEDLRPLRTQESQASFNAFYGRFWTPIHFVGQNKKNILNESILVDAYKQYKQDPSSTSHLMSLMFLHQKYGKEEDTTKLKWLLESACKAEDASFVVGMYERFHKGKYRSEEALIDEFMNFWGYQPKDRQDS